MTIYLNFYLFIYLITLININYLLKNYVFINNSQNSVSYLIIYITKFSKLKNIILTLFLSLVGLPPFILFFIKFNYLINLIYKLNFFLVLLVFLIFFLNMIFYIQIFFHKNLNISLKLLKPLKKNKINYYIIFSSV
jgi:formate hydrogenlyase subunit 3/multisubunit Na+/H+ antiporter MnhD subunit